MDLSPTATKNNKKEILATRGEIHSAPLKKMNVGPSLSEKLKTLNNISKDMGGH